jgi:hypothetical protein
MTCWFLPARRGGGGSTLRRSIRRAQVKPTRVDPAVSIMSHNGVPIQDISDTMGHKSAFSV